jgi:hypothetical protein
MNLVSDGCVGEFCGSPDLVLPALPFFPYMVEVLEIKEQAYKSTIDRLLAPN